jgi:hypothetical protein
VRDWPGSIVKKDRSIATEKSLSWKDKTKKTGMMKKKTPSKLA